MLFTRIYLVLDHLTKWEVWAYKIRLTPPLVIEVPVPGRKSERSCICVLGVSILPLHDFDIWFWRPFYIYYTNNAH
jgi:hypothetical protein